MYEHWWLLYAYPRAGLNLPSLDVLILRLQHRFSSNTKLTPRIGQYPITAIVLSVQTPTSERQPLWEDRGRLQYRLVVCYREDNSIPPMPGAVWKLEPCRSTEWLIYSQPIFSRKLNCNYTSCKKKEKMSGKRNAKTQKDWIQKFTKERINGSKKRDRGKK